MRGAPFSAVVGSTATQVLPGNPKRKCLVLGSDGTNTITYLLRGTAAAGAGLAIGPTNLPLKLHEWEIGALIQEPLSAIGSAAGATANGIEGFE